MDLRSILRPNRPKPGARTVIDDGKAWPAGRAENGKYYGVTDRYGDHVVVMTKNTWEDLGTIIEKQRLTMKGQDTAIKQQSEYIQKLTAQFNDVNERLMILRAAHREVVRANVESGMNPMPLKKAVPKLNLFPTKED